MNRFRELRIENGYKSQANLAKILFVNQTAVSQWERGVTTPSSAILIKLCDLYGVSADYLLGRSDEKQPATVSDGGLTEEQQEIIHLFEAASPEKREAAMAVLRLREARGRQKGSP